LSTIGNLEKLGKLVILCHIPKLSKLLKFSKLPIPLIRTVVNSRTILASEWWIYNARPEKQRRAVLSVLPFVGARGSGSKYAAITLKYLSSK
ncbi:MAG: hypothetical protein IIV72_01745, partial [Alistipes sp.]|nr:hypothetical protein [Alistipes sp.]